MGASVLRALLFSVSLLVLFHTFECSSGELPLKGIDLENPVIDVTPLRLDADASAATGSKDVLFCERIKVAGQTRLKLQSYANAYKISLTPSAVITDKQFSKIQICFHRNASLGLCQCEKDEWKSMSKGFSSIVSPYQDRYVDVKFVGEVNGSVTGTLEEEFQRWRILCLVIGFVLLLLAPIVSSWVPFYYSSSMAIGILLVVIIILFQGMKLVPTGRKSAFYLSISGLVVGLGSMITRYLSAAVNSILANFGISEEMHNPVYVFLVVGIVLAGAALGYWIVRKFVISEDGSVDVGVAQFVKWSMRIVASTSILQSTLDTPLAIGAWASCSAICYFISNFKWNSSEASMNLEDSVFGNGWGWGSGEGPITKKNRAEFLSNSKKLSSRGKLWNSPRRASAFSDSPVQGLMSPPSGAIAKENYYSIIHNTPDRKKFTKREWQEFTEESTKQAVSDLTASPEFTDWVINNADRIQLLPEESSDDSGSDSADEDVVPPPDESRLSNYATRFSKWQPWD